MSGGSGSLWLLRRRWALVAPVGFHGDDVV